MRIVKFIKYHRCSAMGSTGYEMSRWLKYSYYLGWLSWMNHWESSESFDIEEG